MLQLQEFFSKTAIQLLLLTVKAQNQGKILVYLFLGSNKGEWMDKGCGWNKVIKDGMDALLSVVRAKQGLDDPQKGGRIGELLE